MSSDYAKIEKAILYIRSHFSEQPELDVIAKQVHLSPFHFQRLFKKWAGVSPKKFLQYISVEHAKGLLKKKSSLLETSFETGLSGSSRLHDLFVSIEGMTPGEYKNGGENLTIHYHFAPTLFGEALVAATKIGICHLAFVQNKAMALKHLKSLFPKARFIKKKTPLHIQALQIFSTDKKNLKEIKLHLKGTPFQLKVWQSLLQIPVGELTSYANIAKKIRNAKAMRAVGTAIGANRVAYLIPCHRVIQSSGVTGEYRWGAARKTALIGWEAAQFPEEA